MQTSQFEAIKIALKQDKEGMVLTLRIHPDELCESVIRDFVGARYQCVMVRLGDDERPLNRDNFSEIVKLAGMLPRNPQFRQWLAEEGHIDSFECGEEEATTWLKMTCKIGSRRELATNQAAAAILRQVNQEFQAWIKG
jgi:hypothetical protein